jgi:lysozyme
MSLTNPPYAILKSDLEQVIADDEGYRAEIYRCTAGKLTIGYGTNLSAGLPEDEALILMRYRLSKLDAAMCRLWPWYPGLTDRRKMALLAMAYQMGLEGLRGFRKMLAAIERQDWQEAHSQALNSKWAKHDTPQRAARVAAMLLD